jgi:hypothetical protein
VAFFQESQGFKVISIHDLTIHSPISSLTPPYSFFPILFFRLSSFFFWIQFSRFILDSRVVRYGGSWRFKAG